MERMYLISKSKGYQGNVQSTISNGKHVDYSDGLTLEEYNKQKNGDFIALTWDELEPLVKEYTDSLQKPFKEVTEEEFNDMFECLPPMRVNTKHGVFMFAMSEMTTHTLTAWYTRFKGKYFTALRSVYASSDTIAEETQSSFLGLT